MRRPSVVDRAIQSAMRARSVRRTRSNRGSDIARRPAAQPVADAANRLDPDRRAAQLPAQVGDVDVDQVGARIELIAEDLAQDLAAAQDLAPAAQEERE